MHNPAVKLFVQRATAAAPEFQLTSKNALAVVALCRQLDGLPLAIELAAAQTRTLPPEDMKTRLGDRLALLTDGPRDVPSRQRTLRRTIDWSYDLLSAEEQKLLCRLAVFPGGFSLEGAEAVGNSWQDLGDRTTELVDSLTRNNVIQRDAGADAPARFRMLETIREYALEKLDSSGKGAPARKAMAAYALVIAEEGFIASENSGGKAGGIARHEWLRLCNAEGDNLRAALDWLIETENSEWAMRLAAALYLYWETGERIPEGLSRIRAALELPGSQSHTHSRAQLLRALALLTNHVEPEAATPMLTDALELFRELGDPAGIRDLVLGLGVNAAMGGDYQKARVLFEESVATGRKQKDPQHTAAALNNLARALMETGDLAGARKRLREASRLFESRGNQAGLAWTYSLLGDVERGAGKLSEARELYKRSAQRFLQLSDALGLARSYADIADLDLEEGKLHDANEQFCRALMVFENVGYRRGVSTALEGLARLAINRGQPDAAITLAGAAAATRHSIATQPKPTDRQKLESALQLARDALSAQEWENAWRRGLEMRLSDAVAFAKNLDSGGPSSGH